MIKNDFGYYAIATFAFGLRMILHWLSPHGQSPSLLHSNRLVFEPITAMEFSSIKKYSLSCITAMLQILKILGAGSNAARRNYPAAPSDPLALYYIC